MTDAPSPARPGPVALVGSGEFLPAMEAVDAALLAGRPPRAVFLPTAAGQEGSERVDYWIRLGIDHYRRLGVEPVPLAVLDRHAAHDHASAAVQRVWIIEPDGHRTAHPAGSKLPLPAAARAG